MAALHVQLFFGDVAAQQSSTYHACDNVRAFVEALIDPAFDEEQQKLLQGVLQMPGVTQFSMNLEPENRRGKSLQFNRRIQADRNRGVTSSFQLRFGSTVLDVENEATCETRKAYLFCNLATSLINGMQEEEMSSNAANLPTPKSAASLCFLGRQIRSVKRWSKVYNG